MPKAKAKAESKAESIAESIAESLPVTEAAAPAFTDEQLALVSAEPQTLSLENQMEQRTLMEAYDAQAGIDTFALGESTEPYLIATAEQLAELATLVNLNHTSFVNASYQLVADIDLAAYPSWKPIGTNAIKLNGTFDGNGFVIKNLTINEPNLPFQGLFGNIKEVKNLGVINANVTGNSIVGIIASMADNITACYTTGTAAGVIYIGGIAGEVQNISNSYSAADVSGERAGGIVGKSIMNSINCYATGSVSGDNAGGIAGQGKVSSSIALNKAISGNNTADISAVGNATASYARTDLTVTLQQATAWLWNDGTPTATFETIFTNDAAWDYTAELPTLKGVGGVQNGTLPDYIKSGTDKLYISTAEQLAALATAVNGGESYANKTVYLGADIDLSAYENWTPIGTEDAPFGGTFDGQGHKITGLKINAPTEVNKGVFGKANAITNLGVVDVSITANGMAGAVAGKATKITNCYSSGSITTTTTYGRSNAGGIVGHVMENGEITACYSYADINGVSGLGGIVGSTSSNQGCSITDCYSTGNINGDTENSNSTDIGGIVGSLVMSTVNGCYATGSVKGYNGVGGIAGQSQAPNHAVNNCLALNASITSNKWVSNVARVVGDATTISGCYAWSNMPVNGVTEGLTDKNQTGKNGQEWKKSVAAIKDVLGAGSTNWDYTTIAPTLKNVGGSQSGDLPGRVANDYYNTYISTAAEFKAFEEAVNTSYKYNENSKIFLTADIDLSAYDNWTPIGKYNFHFAGTFDGQGHTITGLKIDSNTENPTTDHVGLFGYAMSATIKNLNVKDAIVKGTNVKGSTYVGILVGEMFNENNIIDNCHVTGTVTGQDSVGGIVGSSNIGLNIISISNCSADVNITSTEQYGAAGGIIGSISGDITNCHTSGSVTATGEKGYAGGIVSGNNQGNKIENCYATGSVTATGEKGYAGGIIGDNRGSITACYATGNVSAGNNAGGIAGYNEGSITACYTTGDIKKLNISDGNYLTYGNIGGIVGMSHGGSITNCYATGNISRDALAVGDDLLCVGGIAGTMYGGKIEGCAALGSAVNLPLKTSAKEVHRIAGKISGSPTLVNNYADEGLVFICKTTTPTAEDNKDGADGATISFKGGSFKTTDGTAFSWQTLFAGQDEWKYGTSAQSLPYLLDADKPVWEFTSTGAVKDDFNLQINSVTTDMTSVRFNSVVPNIGGGVQYAISTTNTAPTEAGAWKTLTEKTFTGLKRNTTYYVFARLKNNKYYNDTTTQGVQAVLATTAVEAHWYELENEGGSQSYKQDYFVTIEDAVAKIKNLSGQDISFFMLTDLTYDKDLQFSNFSAKFKFQNHTLDMGSNKIILDSSSSIFFEQSGTIKGSGSTLVDINSSNFNCTDGISIIAAQDACTCVNGTIDIQSGAVVKAGGKAVNADENSKVHISNATVENTADNTPVSLLVKGDLKIDKEALFTNGLTLDPASGKTLFDVIDYSLAFYANNKPIKLTETQTSINELTIVNQHTHTFGVWQSGVRTCDTCGRTQTADIELTTKDGTVTQYGRMDEAIAAAAAAEGSTLKLLRDIVIKGQTEITSGTFTIDLNGKTWEGVGNNNNENVVVIQNAKSDITIGGGTIKKQDYGEAIAVIDKAGLTITDGTYTNNKGTALFALGAGKVDIKGGSFTSKVMSSVGIVNCTENSVHITGGSFNGGEDEYGRKSGVGIYNNPAEGIISTISGLLGEGVAYFNADGSKVTDTATAHTPQTVSVKNIAVQVIAADSKVTYYDTFAEAVTQANTSANSTIKLMANADNAGETLYETTTINLNGYTLNGGSKLLTLQAEGKTLTITDTSANTTGKITGSGYTTVISSEGSITLENGMVENTYASGSAISTMAGTADIKGGTVKATYRGVQASSAGRIVMTGGSIIAKFGIGSINSTAVDVVKDTEDDKYSVVVSGGVINASLEGISATNSTVKITGNAQISGEFIGITVKAAYVDGGKITSNGTGIVSRGAVNIVGGKIEANGYDAQAISSSDALTISGGSFANDNGSSSVIFNVAKAQISGGTFIGGIKLAQTGSGEKLLANVLADGYAFYGGDTVYKLEDTATFISDTVTVKAHTHTFSNWIQQGSGGNITKKCDVCGKSFTVTASGTKGTGVWYTTDVSLKAPTGYKISNAENGTFEQTITLTESTPSGYKLYIKNGDSKPTDVAATYKIDSATPTGKISIGTNYWNTLLNFITFNTFFKNTQQITITADAQLSGTKVDYVLSDSIIDTASLPAQAWIEGSSVSIAPNAKKVIYARLTSGAGVISYINSDGVVVYQDSAQDTESISFTRKGTADVQANVKLNGNTIKAVANGTAVLTADTDYTVDGSKITFKASYLATLKAGDYTINVSYNPMGMTQASGDVPADTSIALKVIKLAGSATDISDIGKTYDGTAVSAPSYTKLGTGAVTLEYAQKGETAYTSTAPSAAGEYTVRVSVEADDDYEAASAIKDFTITMAGLSTIDSVANVTYTATAQTPELTVKSGAKTLAVDTDYTVDYANNTNAGTATFVVTGKGNYQGTLNGSFIIDKKIINVAAEANSKPYGAADPVLTYTADTLFGGDTFTGALTREAGEGVKSDYAISQGTLKLSDNYTLAFTSASFAITKADITLNTALTPAAQLKGKDVKVTVTAKNAAAALVSGASQPELSDITLIPPANVTLKSALKQTAAGVFEAVYTINANASIGKSVFTAKVDSANYNTPTPKTAELNVTDKNTVKMSVTPSKATGAEYGDSITYTAKVEKNQIFAAFWDTIDGTVKFYLGSEATGKLVGTKTIGKDELAVTLDKTTLKVGSYTVTAVYSGNDGFAGASAAASTTISKRVLAWDTSALSAIKYATGDTKASVQGTLKIANEVQGEAAGFSYTSMQGSYDSANAGTHKVTLAVSGAAVTNANYLLPANTPSFTGTIVPATAQVQIPQKDPSGQSLRVVLDEELTIIPADLKNTPYNTAASIKEALKNKLLKADPLNSAANMVIYGSELQVQQNGSWQKAESVNIPSGGIEILMPYPNGANALSHDFTAAQILEDGTVTTLSVRETADGLVVKTTHIGPIALAWKTVNTPEAFVTRLYQISLDRQPDQAGFNSWVAELKNGKKTGAEVVYSFVFSSEFKAKNYCDEHYVTLLYRSILGRNPDENGRNSWISALKTGSTRESILNGFTQSVEFAAMCKQYGIKQGGKIPLPQYGTVPTGPCSIDGKPAPVTQFVTRLYNICLSRQPDAAGLADWTSQLWSHQNTGKEVAMGFVFSKEFEAKRYSNEEYVKILYRVMLNREAEAAGLADWVGRLSKGVSRTKVFNGFAYSTEFQNLCASYGIAAN